MSLGFRVPDSNLLWLTFPRHSTIRRLFSRCDKTLQPLCGSLRIGLGFSHFARHYFGNILFSSGYLDVSVPRVPPVWLCIYHTVHEVCSCGFPHSDIRGSTLMCSSPRLFAAYHVLLRPPVPGHPPCALLRLTFYSLLVSTLYLLALIKF